MKPLAPALLLLVLGVVLAGCAGSGSGPRSSRVVLVHARGVKHAGFLSPTRLAFYRSGSGSCPSVPTRLTVQSPDAIRIDMSVPKSPGEACTTDLLISPVVIQINPKQINVHHQLKVSLYYPLNKHPAVYHVPPL